MDQPTRSRTADWRRWAGGARGGVRGRRPPRPGAGAGRGCQHTGRMSILSGVLFWVRRVTFERVIKIRNIGRSLCSLKTCRAYYIDDM